jgi:WD40 repeat protein
MSNYVIFFVKKCDSAVALFGALVFCTLGFYAEAQLSNTIQTGHAETVTCVQFSSDGKYILSGGKDEAGVKMKIYSFTMRE